jgi:hypothetical protein
VDHPSGRDGALWLRLEDLVPPSVGLDVPVDGAEQPPHAPVGVGDGGRQVGREPDLLAVGGRQPASEVYAVCLQGGEVERPGFGSSDSRNSDSGRAQPTLISRWNASLSSRSSGVGSRKGAA